VRAQPPKAKVAETDFVMVWQLRPATRPQAKQTTVDFLENNQCHPK
jgi:hypothetical protein